MKIDTDSSAPAYHSETAIIDAAQQKVYETLAAIEKWPMWQSQVTESNLSGEPEVGKPFTWKAGGLRFRSQLHTVGPYSEFGWTGKTLWYTAVHNWHFSDLSGKTKVTVKEHLKGPGALFLKKTLIKSMKISLRDLKHHCESGVWSIH